MCNNYKNKTHTIALETSEEKKKKEAGAKEKKERGG
jgi:hypothetical protein